MELQEQPSTPEQIALLPLEDRAPAFLAVHERLTARLGLPLA